MNDYRINVRFHADVPAEKEAAEYLQGLNKSRNKFIVNAVIVYMKDDTEKDKVLLENIRQIFREEVQSVAVLSPSATATVSLEMTEDEKSKNAASVLADLDMFG